MRSISGNSEKLQSCSYIDALLVLYKATQYQYNDSTIPEKIPTCSCCKKSAVLEGFCEQCSGLICIECVAIHNTKKLQKHHVILLKDFNETHLDSYLKTQVLCQEKFHGKSGAKNVEYYCEEQSCQKCICKRCFLLEHRKHKLLNLKEIVQKVEKETKNDLTKIDELSEKLDKELRDSKKQMMRIEQEIKVAKQKVHNAVEALIKKARNHEDSIAKALDRKLEDYKILNAEEQADTSKKIKQLEDFKHRCQTLMDRNKWEIVRIQKDFKSFYKSFSENVKPPTWNESDVKRNITVHYVTNYVICQSIKDMGKIVESVTDESHCSIEKMEEPRYGFVNDMDYVTRSSSGDMTMATRWKRTFLWSKFKLNSNGTDKLKPPRMLRAHSVS